MPKFLVLIYMYMSSDMVYLMKLYCQIKEMTLKEH